MFLIVGKKTAYKYCYEHDITPNLLCTQTNETTHAHT